jgi:hypothetical protein
MSVRFPIEAGGVLTFARALGYDDFTDVVPPTYLQAANHFDPDFRVRPRAGRPWIGANDAVANADASSPPVLHAEQHYEFHAPIVVGDVLVRTDRDSRTWRKTGRRGGELTFTETVQEFRRENGELVAVSRKVIVQPSRVPSGAAS